MKAIITVIGKDKVGIIANVSTYLANNSVNILDISQTIMQDMFCMIMLVNLEKDNVAEVVKGLETLEKELGLSIRLQREELFESMHRI